MRNELGTSRRVIYTDLDSLFDTRLGVIAHHRPELLDYVLNKTPYHARVVDAWEGLSLAEFKDLYAKRDNYVLRESKITNLLKQIHSLIFDFSREVINEPFRKIPKVVVNLHPYQISPLVQTQISEAILSHIGEVVPVELELINMENTENSIKWVKDEYTVMFMYDGLDWMESQSKDFEEHINPQLKLYVPALHKDVDPRDPEVAEGIRQIQEQTKLHPFQFVEQLAKPLIDLELLPVKLFSIISR